MAIKGAGAFMKPNKCYGLFIHYREKESYRSLNYSFQRLSYPSTSQRPKWKFLPCFNRALQSFKGNPHIFLIPRDWLVGVSSSNLWKLCAWICCFVSPFMSYETINDHLQANFYFKVL